MKKLLIGLIIGVFLVTSAGMVIAKPTGYNWKANVFVGTGLEWCMQKFGNTWGTKDACRTYLGVYADDKLVMKWNAEWTRGKTENWSNPPYDAWENNNWNGMFPGGSGSIWHYKIKWVGPCGADGTPLSDGSYCLWGQFAVLMDQGKDPSMGPGHIWFTHGIPSGYGQ